MEEKKNEPKEKRSKFWDRVKIPSKGPALTDEEMERMLAELMQVYSMTPETLSRLLGVSSDLISDFAGKKQELTGSKKTIFAYSLMLIYSLTDTPADMRVQAYLQVLMDKEALSARTIAAFARMEEDDIWKFLVEPESLSVEMRYQLGAVVMHLRYLFTGLAESRPKSKRKIRDI